MSNAKTKKVITPEQKAEKFKILATARVNRALRLFRQIGNLASNNYNYTPEQVTRMFNFLKNGLAEAESRFLEKGKKNKTEFTF